jgi:hypothetical protein
VLSLFRCFLRIWAVASRSQKAKGRQRRQQTARSFYLLSRLILPQESNTLLGRVYPFFLLFCLAGCFLHGYVCAQGGQACCPVTALHCWSVAACAVVATASQTWCGLPGISSPPSLPCHCVERSEMHICFFRGKKITDGFEMRVSGSGLRRGMRGLAG